MTYQLPYSPVCFAVSPIPKLHLTFGVYTPDIRICNGSSDQWWLAYRQWCTDLIEWFHRIGNETSMPTMPDADHTQYNCLMLTNTQYNCLMLTNAQYNCLMLTNTQYNCLMLTNAQYNCLMLTNTQYNCLMLTNAQYNCLMLTNTQYNCLMLTNAQYNCLMLTILNITYM